MPKDIQHNKIVSDNTLRILQQKWEASMQKMTADYSKMVADVSVKSKELSKLGISAESIKKQEALASSVDRTKVKFSELTDVQKEHKRVTDQYTKVLNQQRIASGYYSTELEKEKANLRQINQLKKAKATADVAETGSIRQLTAALSNNVIKYKALSAEQRKNRTIGGNLLKTIKRQTKELNKMNKPLGGLRSAFSTLTKSVKNFIFAYVGVAGLSRIAKSVFNTTKELDSLDFSIKAVITDVNELAITQLYLNDVTERFGLDMVATTRSYLRFRAATKTSNLSLKETQGIFETFSKTASVLGLKTDDLRGIFLALEQMVSKSNVTTEELRRQLGERLFGAFNIMAQSLGVTTSELNKMLKQGEILAEDVLPRFAEQVEKTFGIENVDKVDNLVAAQGRLTKSWQLFIKELNSSQAFAAVMGVFTDMVEEARKTLQTEEEQYLESTFGSAKKASDEFFESIPEDITIAEKFKLISDEAKKAGESLEKERGKIIKTGLEAIRTFPGVVDALKTAEEFNKAIKVYTARQENYRNILLAYGQDLVDVSDDEKDEVGILTALNEQLKDLRKNRLDASSGAEINVIDLRIKKVTELIKSYDVLKNTLKTIEEGEKGADDAAKDFAKTVDEIAEGIFDEQDEAQKRDTEAYEADRDKRLKADESYYGNLRKVIGAFRNTKKKQYEDDISDLDLLLKHKLITEEEYHKARKKLFLRYNAEIINLSARALNELANAALSYNDIQVEAFQREIDLHTEKISSLESMLNKEKKLLDDGEANNYDRIKRQIDNEKKLRDESVKNLRKAKKKEAQIELAAQISNLILATTEIYASHSTGGLAGVLIATAAVGTMLASIAQYKAKINAAADEPLFEEGGRVDGRKGKRLKGKRHKEGGVKVTAEGDEWIINRNSSLKSDKLLSDINAGKMTDADYQRYLYSLNFPNLLGGTVASNEELKELKKIREANEKMADKEAPPTAVPMGDGRFLIVHGKNDKEIFHG